MSAASTSASTSAPVSARPADADSDAAARQVDEILGRLESVGGRDSRAAGDELVRALMRFYGAGLARVLELVGAGDGPAPLEPLLADSRVAALLTLHDLHPDDLRTRVQRALASMPDRPFELAGLDEAALSVTLAQAAKGGGCGSGCGSSSTPEAAQEAVEVALACFAPELEVVEVREQPSDEPALLQIGVRPGVVSGARR